MFREREAEATMESMMREDEAVRRLLPTNKTVKGEENERTASQHSRGLHVGEPYALRHPRCPIFEVPGPGVGVCVPVVRVHAH